MHISLKDLIDSVQPLTRLSAIPLNSPLKFRLARVLKQTKDEIDTYNTARTELCEKYGTLNKEKNEYDFEPEQREKFDAEYAALIKEEVEIRFDTFSEDTMKDVPIASMDIMNLAWLFGGLEDGATVEES